MEDTSKTTPFYLPAREWDCRFNVPTDQDLQNLLTQIKAQRDAGKYRYILVSGVEIGEKHWQTDYKIKHVHVAMIFLNNVTKSSILKNLNVRKGLGYYISARNKDLPYSGWIKHHTKRETKVDPEITQLLEYGECPKDKDVPTKSIIFRSEKEKKSKTDACLIAIRKMLEDGTDDKIIFEQYPRLFTQWGEKLKSMMEQTSKNLTSNGDPHIWLYGPSGLGKSTILQVIYPQYYLKSLETKFFDCYSRSEHSHILLQDVDYNVMEKLGVVFFKTICDEGGYTIDKKYHAVQRERLAVLVSSQFTIEQCVPEDLKGRRENVEALHRRFFEVNINNLLMILGLKLIPQYDINRLKIKGNKDPRELFMCWDYLRNCPTGEEVKSAEEYQKIIKEYYYGVDSNKENMDGNIESTSNKKRRTF